MFTDLFIRRPILAVVVSALILLVGARSYTALSLRQFPLLYNTVINVNTGYPGASAEVMQGFITQPMEQAIASAEGIDYLTSSSTQGSSAITATIKLNYDPEKALTEVMAKAQQVKYLIPTAAADPIITKETGGQQTAMLYVSFSSPVVSAAALSDYIGRVVQPMISTIPGVAQADVYGGQPFSMRLWLDQRRMAARGVSPDDIAAAIRANNFQSAPGQMKGYFTITNISADTDLSTPEDFKNLVVKAKNDALVRIGDVATVELGPQSTNNGVIVNRQTAVFIAVEGTPDANPIDTAAGIRAILPDIERTLPPNVKMAVPFDSTVFIRSSISEVIRTLVLAVLIVIIVIYLFLGSIRSVLIPVATIPLSMIGALSIMLALGFSLNLLTLLAMVLAIGLVVDDAIVVVENVYRGIEAGRTPIQAALIGAREIVGPVISMTITLAAVYTPIGFLGGITGTLFREFAFTLAGAVLISGVVALTLSPVMCSVLLRERTTVGWFERKIEQVLGFVNGVYARLLHGTLNYRPVTLIFAAGIIAILTLEYISSGTELAPSEDEGFVIGVLKGPQSANLDYMKKYIEEVQGIAGKVSEIALSFAVEGVNGLNTGISGFVLTPWGDRTRNSAAIQSSLQAQITNQVAGTNVFLVLPASLPGNANGLPVQMVVSTTASYPELFKYMEQIKDRANKSKLFIVTDSDLAFDQPVVKLHVNRAKASDIGLTMQSVGDALALMVGENYVNRFNLEGRSYEVITQVPRSDRMTPEKLTQYYVTTSSGISVPLSTVVSISESTEPNALNQYNQLNSATFGAVMYPKRTMGEGVAFLKRTAAEILPRGYQYDFLSEARQYTQEGNELTVTFLFALVVIYLVLAAQFESLRDPLVILVSVPMALCGALLPIFFGAATLNIYTEVGLVTLVGLISKHGILMVEFANKAQIEHNLNRRAAIEAAAHTRLRPILMTTAAMVAGLFPLLLASGAGAASRHAIGIVIVMGMSIGTIFTLFVLPTVYTFLAENHVKRQTSRRAVEVARVTG